MTIETLIKSIPKFIDSVLVPLVFALAFIAFLWGVYTYFIQGAASDEQRETGRKFVMWSIIGFVIMLSLGGIILLLQNSLGLKSGTRTCLPSITGDCKYEESAQTSGGGQGEDCKPDDKNACAGSYVCTEIGLFDGTQYKCL